MLNTDNKIRYKARKYLHFCNPKKIESVFLEMFETKKRNAIIGYIHKHSKVSKGELTIFFFCPSYGKKEVIILSNFNIKILYGNNDKEFSSYTAYSNSFYSQN